MQLGNDFQGKKCARCRGEIHNDPAFEDALWYHRACLVLQRDFVTSHPGVPGRAGDGTDTRRGSVPGYTGPAPMPPGA